MKNSIVLFILILFCISCEKKADNDENLAIFRYNESAGVLTTDPAFAKDLPHIWIANQLYNSLVSLDEQMEIIPAIAKSWEISEDGTTYTFYLRNDVFFHKNQVFIDSTRLVVADDVVYSFNRLVDPKLNAPGSWIFSSVKKDSTGYAFKALNDTVFQVELEKPFPPFLGMLSMTYASIVPHEAVSFYGDNFRNNPVGTGPFVFTYWKEGVRMVLRKNPNYFEKENNEQLPHIDAVSISFLIDKQIAFMEFIKGNFDFMSGIDARYKDELLTFDGTLRKKYENRIQLFREPFFNTEYIGFYVPEYANLNKKQYLALRKAVNYAIDREKMIRFLRNGIGIPGHAGMIPISMLKDFKTANYGYSFKPELAIKLIQENQLSGTRLSLSTTAEYVDLGKYVQAQLSALGLNVSVEVMPSATMRQMRAIGSLPFFRASWVADYPDPENYLSLFYSPNKSPYGPNYTHFSNTEFDVLYEKSMTLSDDNERFLIYRQMDSILMSEAPVVILFYDEILRFVNQRVQNFKTNPTNLLDLRKVKIEPEN
ncbi:MAG: ABC transporter substrate-binding protein [Lentimicrobiaceae bacterium]|nr:ABC transporter substrate-binding protein [Lentimicrobiaceae bacterium]